MWWRSVIWTGIVFGTFFALIPSLLWLVSWCVGRLFSYRLLYAPFGWTALVLVIFLWCAGVDGCMFSLEREFFSYKMIELGGWAAYFVKTGDNDSVNGHIAGIDAVIECYNRYPKTLKKDKKKILAFKKMQ